MGCTDRFLFAFQLTGSGRKREHAVLSERLLSTLGCRSRRRTQPRASDLAERPYPAGAAPPPRTGCVSGHANRGLVTGQRKREAFLANCCSHAGFPSYGAFADSQLWKFLSGSQSTISEPALRENAPAQSEGRAGSILDFRKRKRPREREELHSLSRGGAVLPDRVFLSIMYLHWYPSPNVLASAQASAILSPLTR